MTKKIAFQGIHGAYTEMPCLAAYPDYEPLPCVTCGPTLEAVHSGKAELGMLPCENSQHGRVAGIHVMLPESNLFVIGEQFLRVHHCLLGVPGATIKDIKRVHSMDVALNQVRNIIKELNVQEISEIDTAEAARIVAKLNNKEDAAIASSLAAEIYGLEILRANVEDSPHNTTRFYVLAREMVIPHVGTPNVMTSFVFRVRNIPGALYKSLGGFATNGINMTKLESYMLNGEFKATQFLCEVEAHPETQAFKNAFEELSFFASEVKILGVFPESPFRQNLPGRQKS